MRAFPLNIVNNTVQLSRESRKKIPHFSISGGRRDLLVNGGISLCDVGVHDDQQQQQQQDLCISVATPGMSGVGLTVDHDAAMWCNQVQLTLSSPLSANHPHAVGVTTAISSVSLLAFGDWWEYYSFSYSYYFYYIIFNFIVIIIVVVIIVINVIVILISPIFILQNY